MFIKLWLDVKHSTITILLLWLIEAEVFQIPQLHKHFNVVRYVKKRIPIDNFNIKSITNFILHKLSSRILLIVLIASAGCILVPKENQKSEVKFYKRDEGGGSENGKAVDTTYFDYLVITNYVDGNFTVNDFYKIAKSYVDTTRADKRISGVTLLGQEPNDELPYPSYNNPISKYRLVSFGFHTASSDSLWKKGDLMDISTLIGDDYKIYWTFISKDKKVIDSLLQSKTKFHR